MRPILIALLVVVAVVGLGWHLTRVSAATDLSARRAADLVALREDLADLDRDALLSLRDGTMTQAIAEEWADIRKLQRHLETADGAAEELQLAGLDDALANEQVTLGRFTLADNVLRHSERRFAKTMHELLEDPKTDQNLVGQLHWLEERLIAFDAGDRSQLDDIVGAVVSIGTRPSLERRHPHFEEALVFARAVLDAGGEVDNSLHGAIDNRAAENAVASITRMLQEKEGAAARQTAIERAVLVLLALSLLAMLIQAMRNLRRRAQDLNRALTDVERAREEIQLANRELENRVSERTAELASRNRELSDSVTALTQARERLTLSEKMATVGTMAAGVAHEISNPASYIMSNADFLLEELERAQPLWQEGGELDLPPAKDMVAAAAAVKEGVDRIARIVKDLKAFSRESNDEKKDPVDLVEVIEQSLRMASSKLKTRAKVVKSLPKVPSISGNASRLGQVFLNLFINAEQALPDRPTNELRVSMQTVGETIEVTVGDNGTGIPPDVMKRIFEPFFTTKPVGIGTGLGLSICHGIIEKHGGTIEVDSTVGVGTTFKLRFPVAIADTNLAGRAAA